MSNLKKKAIDFCFSNEGKFLLSTAIIGACLTLAIKGIMMLCDIKTKFSQLNECGIVFFISIAIGAIIATIWDLFKNVREPKKEMKIEGCCSQENAKRITIGKLNQEIATMEEQLQGNWNGKENER